MDYKEEGKSDVGLPSERPKGKVTLTALARPRSQHFGIALSIEHSTNYSAITVRF